MLPYGGHDGDGEEEGVWKCPLVAPAFHLFPILNIKKKLFWEFSITINEH